MNKILVIIPAYNEEENIIETVRCVEKVTTDCDYVVVNDCSRDSTLKLCRENGINVVNLPINLGIGGAVQTGYKYAAIHGYEYAVQLDGDGQHDPADISRMYDVITKQNADMVIGSRFVEKEGFQSYVIRRWGIKYFSILISLLTKNRITDPTSGYRMVNREVIELFAKVYPRDFPEPESTVALLKRRKKIVEIPVIMRERQGGESSINIKAGFYYMIKVSLAIIMERIR